MLGGEQTMEIDFTVRRHGCRCSTAACSCTRISASDRRPTAQLRRLPLAIANGMTRHPARTDRRGGRRRFSWLGLSLVRRTHRSSRLLPSRVRGATSLARRGCFAQLLALCQFLPGPASSQPGFLDRPVAWMHPAALPPSSRSRVSRYHTASPRLSGSLGGPGDRPSFTD